jgi:hypothetical protein
LVSFRTGLYWMLFCCGSSFCTSTSTACSYLLFHLPFIKPLFAQLAVQDLQKQVPQRCTIKQPPPKACANVCAFACVVQMVQHIPQKRMPALQDTIQLAFVKKSHTLHVSLQSHCCSAERCRSFWASAKLQHKCKGGLQKERRKPSYNTVVNLFPQR